MYSMGVVKSRPWLSTEIEELSITEDTNENQNDLKFEDENE